MEEAEAEHLHIQLVDEFEFGECLRHTVGAGARQVLLVLDIAEADNLVDL